MRSHDGHVAPLGKTCIGRFNGVPVYLDRKKAAMKRTTPPLKGVTTTPSLDQDKLVRVIERLMRETNGCNSDATALIGVLDGRQIHLTITTDKHAFLRTSKDKCLTFTEPKPL